MATALRTDLAVADGAGMTINAGVGVVGCGGGPCGMFVRGINTHRAHINGSGSGHA